MEKGIQTPMAQGRTPKIIEMIRRIRTSRLSMKKNLSQQAHGDIDLMFDEAAMVTSRGDRKVDIRLHGRGNSNFHGARPVH